jgi:potassium-transporting ATPase KdpC subunit
MRAIRTQLLLTLATLVLGAGLYPLAVLAIGQGFFRDSANGSLIVDADGTVRGSRLVAQPFASDEWFQPRPSAVDYNAASSGGSNLGASNPKLRDRVVEQLKSLPTGQSIPADAVTTSGSGLDPYISVAYAKIQAQRVAKARNVPLEELNQLIDKQAISVLGSESILNVVELNRSCLDRSLNTP